MTQATLIKDASKWLEALLCAAAAGDQKASDIYSIAKRIADGEEVSAIDCETFESYCLWIVEMGGDA